MALNLETKEIFTEEERTLKHKKEISESIRYASYIQKALLPSDDVVKSLFPEHFIFYRPRDIVSGDFYWVARRKNEIILAVADCTGHGVPGAFMSILGITVLSDVVNKGNFSSSGSVLNQMRERIMKSLNQTGDENEQKDGIDMGLCIINTENGRLEFSGAFNPVYIIKDGEFIEISGDKMPIGVAAEEEKSFKTNRIQIAKGDHVYLFTDGFADQFGGENGKKFKYKSFRDMFTAISGLPVAEQKNEIEKVFLSWKRNYPQLDDVLIFGFRYHCS